MFLLHVIQPDSYPIFDQHVYRAYLFIAKNQRAEIPDNKRKQDVYFKEYAPFFNELASKGVSRKKLDEALWGNRESSKPLTINIAYGIFCT